MDWREARDLFPITRQKIYLHHAGVSPFSDRVRAAVEEIAAQGNLQGADYEAYQQDVLETRGALARLLGGRPEEIAFTRSTSHGLSILAFGLDWQAGDNVVGARWEYPANLFPWMALGDRGVELRLVEPEGGRITPEAIFALCDARTRLVALSWVQFWNGFRADIATIAAECRRQGILFAVDVIQGLGALRLEVEEAGCDFAAAGSGKWLMAIPGVGVAWCRSELIERLRPVTAGTHSMEDGTAYFDPRLEWKRSAERFEESVPASSLNLAALRAAAGLLLEVGPEVIEERVLGLSRRLGEGLADLGYNVIAPWPREPSESSGIVSFNRPGVPCQELLRDLTAAGVVCRTHRDFVRLAPHFYNTEAEIDRVLEILSPRQAMAG